MDPTTALIVAVLLGPLAAAYDFCTNPAAPPQIFTAQFTEDFGHAPGANLPLKTQPKIHKRVYVTHG